MDCIKIFGKYILQIFHFEQFRSQEIQKPRFAYNKEVNSSDKKETWKSEMLEEEEKP